MITATNFKLNKSILKTKQTLICVELNAFIVYSVLNCFKKVKNCLTLVIAVSSKPWSFTSPNPYCCKTLVQFRSRFGHICIVCTDQICYY